MSDEKMKAGTRSLGQACGRCRGARARHARVDVERHPEQRAIERASDHPAEDPHYTLWQTELARANHWKAACHQANIEVARLKKESDIYFSQLRNIWKVAATHREFTAAAD